jgi:hypothetical protein
VNEPFHCPNTSLLLLGYAKAYFHLPYRQTEGIAKGHAHGKVPSTPKYSTISRRTNGLDVKINDDDYRGKELNNQHVIIAISSAGIRVTSRGQWMNEKWKVRKKDT